jgi:hypothetical protein
MIISIRSVLHLIMPNRSAWPLIMLVLHLIMPDHTHHRY